MRFVVGNGAVDVNVPSREALLGEVAGRLKAKRGFAIATLNLDHLVKLSQESFRKAYAAHDLVTADGRPIVWMSRLARRPVALVTGSDLILPLARVAAAHGAPLGLFGASDETLALAAARLADRVPGLKIAAAVAPPMGFDPGGPAAAAAIRDLRAAGARIVLVALGAPKQELFAALGRRNAPDMGFAGIGAGLDFIAGVQNRAPGWVQGLAMEWLWRMLSNPRRLVGRYAQCLAILPGHALRALAQRGAPDLAAEDPR